MEFYKTINKALLKRYGKDELNRPIYRIVQNGRSVTERRKGKYNIFYGHIFIREESGVLEVPKYPSIPDGHWILEKLFYTTNPELTEKHSYEPMWHFHKDGEYQAPNLKACEFIIRMALEGPKSVESADEVYRKEVEEFYEYLGGNASIADYLHGKEGVSYAGLNPKVKSE